MKRSNAARLASIGVAFWATSMGGAAWAQTTTPAEPTAPVAPAATNNAEIEAAKKEVQAYEVAYRKMEKSTGPISAMRFFLTPDYKNIDAMGRKHNRNEHIKIWQAIFAKEKPKEAQTTEKPVNEKATPDDVTEENYFLENDMITVMEHSDLTFAAPASSTSGTEASASHQWRIVQISRSVYRRTPNGLRLQEESMVSVKSYLDGKLKFQGPVPRLPK